MRAASAIRKILIAEDLDAIASGVEKALRNMADEITHVRYCDDAWLKLKKAALDGEPYDLLITDLSFKPDHRKVEITGGEELIKTIRKDQIPCKIIVFSIEDRAMKTQNFFDEYTIDAYVLKGRNDMVELPKAVRSVSLGDKYLSDEMRLKIHAQKNISQIEPIDLKIVRYLCEGLTQEEISKVFREKDIKPNSMSTIEKRLKNLREEFSAKTNIELVMILNEMGLV